MALVCAIAAWSLARTKSASPPTLAQRLRDAPVGGDIAAVVRQSDGVISRFDRAGGAFLATDTDGGRPTSAVRPVAPHDPKPLSTPR